MTIYLLLTTPANPLIFFFFWNWEKAECIPRLVMLRDGMCTQRAMFYSWLICKVYFQIETFSPASYSTVSNTSLYKCSLENTWFKKEKNPPKTFSFCCMNILGRLRNYLSCPEVKNEWKLQKKKSFMEETEVSLNSVWSWKILCKELGKNFPIINNIKKF